MNPALSIFHCSEWTLAADVWIDFSGLLSTAEVQTEIPITCKVAIWYSVKKSRMVGTCLALMYTGKVAGVEGLEPPTIGFGDRCSTNSNYTPNAQALYVWEHKGKAKTHLVFLICSVMAAYQS